MVEMVTGWGRSIFSRTNIKNFQDSEQIESLDIKRGAIPRGFGRSYGDSASNSGGTTIQTELLKKISIDPISGIAILGAGVSISELELESLEKGLFPYVVPGTSKVSIGGAIASDIHGKSHHKVGSFSEHLLEVKIVTSDGKLQVLTPSGKTSRLFWATVGGMGMTGIIVEATIQLRKVDSNLLEVKEVRVQDLEELLSRLSEFDEKYLYTVAWIDLSGRYRGRGVVSGANHLSNEGHRLKKRHPKSSKTAKLKEYSLPRVFHFGLINRLSIRIFNSIWYHKPLAKEFQEIRAYMHPLDGVANWNLVYGGNGFLQYQFVIPFEQKEILARVLEILRIAKFSSLLTVLKSFGVGSNGLLSFPMKGWTLAIDLPLGNKNLSGVIRDLDQIIVGAGGRVYLSKDSCTSSTLIPLMYPRIEEWKRVKQEFDPLNLWQSDQGRRLDLC